MRKAQKKAKQLSVIGWREMLSLPELNTDVDQLTCSMVLFGEPQE